jgi:hypothetical protein
VHQKFGKPRHIGYCQKGLDEANQTITFNYDESVGSKEILVNFDYLCQHHRPANILEIFGGKKNIKLSLLLPPTKHCTR